MWNYPLTKNLRNTKFIFTQYKFNGIDWVTSEWTIVNNKYVVGLRMKLENKEAYLILSKNSRATCHWSNSIWHPCACQNWSQWLVIVIRANDGRIICISIHKAILEWVKEAISNVGLNFWHRWFGIINEIYLNWREDDDLIPRYKNGLCHGTEWRSLELQCNCATSIYQNIKPVEKE